MQQKKSDASDVPHIIFKDTALEWCLLSNDVILLRACRLIVSLLHVGRTNVHAEEAMKGTESAQTEKLECLGQSVFLAILLLCWITLLIVRSAIISFTPRCSQISFSSSLSLYQLSVDLLSNVPLNLLVFPFSKVHLCLLYLLLKEKWSRNLRTFVSSRILIIITPCNTHTLLCAEP